MLARSNNSRALRDYFALVLEIPQEGEEGFTVYLDQCEASSSVRWFQQPVVAYDDLLRPGNKVPSLAIRQITFEPGRHLKTVHSGARIRNHDGECL